MCESNEFLPKTCIKEIKENICSNINIEEKSSHDSDSNNNDSNEEFSSNDEMFYLEKEKNFCDCCKRCSIEGYDIELQVLKKTVTGKKFGAMNNKKRYYTNPTLCYFCTKHMTSKSRNISFQESWAAYIYTKLQEGYNNNINADSIHYFPSCFQMPYKNVATSSFCGSRKSSVQG